MSLEKKLLTYAEHNLNVMLIGSHGIGKSTVVKAVAEKLGMRFKYYSSSTLDPFAELIGIPVPDKDRGTVDFFRPHDSIGKQQQSDSHLPKESGVSVKTATPNVSCVPGS